MHARKNDVKKGGSFLELYIKVARIPIRGGLIPFVCLRAFREGFAFSKGEI